MSDQPSPQPETSSKPETLTSPWRCLSGALISGGLGLALYRLTMSIAQTFAAKPIHSDNITVVNLTVAVRTLVVGMSALGTGIFGLVTVGLIALSIQLLIQKGIQRSA